MASKSSPSRPRDGTRRPTSELAEAGGELLPHFHGHRQRLRERFLAGGRDALADYELIELLLFMAIPRVDIKPLAKQLLAEFKTFAATISAPAERLKEFGLSENAITSLKVVEEAARRLAEGAVIGRPVLSSWEALVDYCAISIGHAPTEAFHVLFLDRKNVLIKDEAQSKGTVDHTPVYPREVVKRALELGASALILVHNHPSGDPTPSRGDIAMTREIVNAAKALKIEVHDHLVIGRGRHASFKALGLL
jgi:DNA repair protein RadC